ncbi:unnamed protein product [Alternaria alternata]
MSWRLPYILQAALAVLWATGSFFLPESPRWLILHGRRNQAVEELKKLDFGTAEAEKDVLRPVESAAAEDQIGVLAGLRLIFTKDHRSQTWLAVFILSFIQLSGIDGVLYVCVVPCRQDVIALANTISQYAPTIFAQAGIPSQTASFLASGISAILMLGFSIPATLFANK